MNVRLIQSRRGIATVVIASERPGVRLLQSSACPARRSSTFMVTRRQPRYFDVTADSGHTTRRAFCAECGSPLFGQPGSRPDMVTIRAGSLDDPSDFRPSRDIFTASAQPWDCMNPDIPKTPKLS